MQLQQYTPIKLPIDTYISDVEPFLSGSIPNKSIIHKKITGCGITTFEIRFAKHHSIIILPNVPVIEGKVDEHNDKFPDSTILGVHKGIDVDDIKAYLLKPVEYKKILTTPEGFIDKVLKAFKGREDVMKQDYFLLYDECERIITDVSYRGKIAAPLDIFFEFDKKALVSATTLPFRDERFKEFEHYEVKPLYDYSKPLTVINTNNVITSLKAYIDKLNSKHVCIFFNSTDGIRAVADTLQISKHSKAFCAQESVVKLMERGYMNGSSNFDDKNMAQYNFFTSRYFSAMDIKLDYKPDVILISDIFFADHSILDPHTEVIQIAGRFRNGISSLTHITNCNPLLETKTQQEALTYLEGCLDTYEHILDLFKNSKQKGAQDTLEFFVEHSPIATFYSNSKRNNFMIDNDLNNERVKAYYKDKIALQLAYDELTDHFVVTYENEEHLVGDGDMRMLKRLQTKKEKYRQVAILLERYTAPQGAFKFLSETAEQQQNILSAKYPKIAEAHRLIGLKGLDATEYDTININKAVAAAKKQNQIVRLTPFVHAACEAYSNAKPMQTDDLYNVLSSIYSEQHITFACSASHVKWFFLARRSTKGGKNVYIIGDKLYPPPIQK
jgi:hypothetical protein